MKNKHAFMNLASLNEKKYPSLVFGLGKIMRFSCISITYTNWDNECS